MGRPGFNPLQPEEISDGISAAPVRERMEAGANLTPIILINGVQHAVSRLLVFFGKIQPSLQ